MGTMKYKASNAGGNSRCRLRLHCSALRLRRAILDVTTDMPMHTAESSTRRLPVIREPSRTSRSQRVVRVINPKSAMPRPRVRRRPNRSWNRIRLNSATNTTFVPMINPAADAVVMVSPT
ncbi:hypothetical protein DSECCO2_393760 [anaerobic digester metagenome]